MNKPKLIKFVVKGAIGAVVALGIGYAIKGENYLKERIDDHFDETEAETSPK